MKRPIIRMAGLVVITTLIGFGAVALPRNEKVKQFFVDKNLKQVLADYTNNTVLKTLNLVVHDIKELHTVVVRLQTDPTDKNLNDAAAAWRVARAQWKMTDAFMYGPASFYNYDKQLSAWPLDRPMVDHTVGEIAAGKLQLDEHYLRNSLNASQRGFLAAEYLLFREGQPRKAEDISPAELTYLVATTHAMVLESMDFEASWLGSDKLPAQKAAALRAAGIKSRTSYAHEFKNPGKPGSRYLSASVPLQEIFQDSLGIIEELCPAIEEVLGSDDPRDSDTWYSHNGLADIQNGLQGVENSYLGGVEGTRGHGVSELLAIQNDVLDRRVKIAFADTAYRIEALRASFGEDHEGKELAVKIAVAACHKLATRLSFASPLVSMDPGTRPWALYGY